jgi:hypothetical protein
MWSKVILLGCLVAGCAGSSSGPNQAQPLPSIEVFFAPAPFAYRVGPEVMTTATDSSVVRADLGAQGALLGCDAIVDITISTKAHNGKARSWGFCAYRVQNDKSTAS